MPYQQKGDITQTELGALVGVSNSKIAEWQRMPRNAMPRDKQPALQWLVDHNLLEGTSKADLQRGVDLQKRGRPLKDGAAKGDVMQVTLAAAIGLNQSQVCKMQHSEIDPMPRDLEAAVAWAKERKILRPFGYRPKSADQTGTFHSFRFADTGIVAHMMGNDCALAMRRSTAKSRWRLHEVLYFALENGFDIQHTNVGGFYIQDAQTFERLRKEREQAAALERLREPDHDEVVADALFEACSNLAGMIVRWRSDIKQRTKPSQPEIPKPTPCHRCGTLLRGTYDAGEEQAIFEEHLKTCRAATSQPDPDTADEQEVGTATYDKKKNAYGMKVNAEKKKGPCTHDWLPRQRGGGLWCRVCGESKAGEQ